MGYKKKAGSGWLVRRLAMLLVWMASWKLKLGYLFNCRLMPEMNGTTCWNTLIFPEGLTVAFSSKIFTSSKWAFDLVLSH
jgi:hypothetical protein